MKREMKNGKTIIISIIVGFAVAILVMAVAIYLGYTNAYNSNVNEINISIFGINIYSLTKNVDKYNGSSIGQNMGIICTIFIAGAVCIERIITRVKSKN